MLPDIGFTEILLIGVVALLVLRPEDFPLLMRRLGMLSVTFRANMMGMWQGWQEHASSKPTSAASLSKKPRVQVDKD